MDQIKALLLQTGWSCEELIKNINQFKHNIVEDPTKVTKDLTIKINGQRGVVSFDIKAKNTGCKSNGTDSDASDPPQHISFDEVENDHSYTCRIDNDRNSKEVQKEVKIDIKEACKYTANCIRRYLIWKRRIFKKKFDYPRKLKRRYRLLRKNAMTDRKMLICKYKSKEVVRNEIMHQLELLRSKRTLGISSGIKQTVISEQVFLKKRYSGDKSKEETGCSETCKELSLGITEISDDDTPPTLSIAEQKVGTTEHKKDFYSIKPTKTNDITKIKGWKNKKFTSINHRLKTTDEFPKICEVTQDNTLKLKLPSTAKSDPKSAFASTNLDGFLHDSANLYISFDIPTLDSGGNESSTNTIVKPDEPPIKTDPIPPVTSTSSADDNLEDDLLKVVKVDTVNLYRPRTLGQKRRIWKLKADTRMKRKTEEIVSKPRTLAEKRRMLGCGMDAKSKLKNVESGDGTLKYSYVLHRGRRLRIPTRSESGLIASIKSHNGRKDYIYVPKKIRPIKMKPSIFATTLAQQSQVIKYRPGPLSKKTCLQEYNKEWTTEIKPLPKIYLQVTPQLNKPICPKITHLLPDYGFELTEERVSFALSALRTEKTEQSFTFPVHYANNQQCMLLRRKITPREEKKLPPEIDKVEDSETINETVQNVIDKMLDYVEIKNISEEVVRDDLTDKILQEEKANGNEQLNNVSKKRKPKQSKTNYELKRLNVKVIEVNLEDKGDSDDCDKDFCQLGCVCKSLSTTSSLVSNHCGVPDCMFQCKCNYEKKSKGNLKVTLPIGTDLLSEGAVNRLEVEAKKNLARVEKEFTQTVIQANNQTIVVGGCTNRQRRVTKLPKKYTDYIDNSDEASEVMAVVEDDVDPPPLAPDDKLKDWKPMACSVGVANLNLKEVIPFCLVHNLHDCHCKFTAQFDTAPKEESKEKTETKDGLDWFKRIYSSEALTQTCARTKGLPTNYYLERNKSERFIATRRRKLDKMYKTYLHRFIRCESEKDSEDVTVHVVQDAENNSRSSRAVESNTQTDTEKRTRRKQSLLIRRDSSPILQESPENAIQRRKKPKKRAKASPETSIGEEQVETKTVTAPEDHWKSFEIKEKVSKFEQIFQTMNTPKMSNLFTPSLLIQEKLTEILGKSVGSDTQFRLIPWDMLVKKYETSRLQLWHSTYFKKPRIIATDNKTIPKHFVNVRKYESVPNKDLIKADVIRWLVTRKVPGTNSKENIFVIVQLSKTHCELCGLWEKKQNNEKDKMVLISQPPDKPDTDNNRLYSIVKKIMFSKCKFAKQMLLETGSSDDTRKIPAMSAYLPPISTYSKWRMIRLNSDFSVLSLHRNKYAIKYSDLQKVMKMAKETSHTIVLKTPEVETNYPHPDFGLYASADCDDMIFIGPYYHHEDHDITTLRYANRELIRTEIFCRMKGLKPPCTGVWLYQLALVSPNVENLQTIDLTECESDPESKLHQSGFDSKPLPIVHSDSKLLPIVDSDSKLIPIVDSEPKLLPIVHSDSNLLPKVHSEWKVIPKVDSEPKPVKIEEPLSSPNGNVDGDEIAPAKKSKHSKGVLITPGDLLNFESRAGNYVAPPTFYKYVREEKGQANFALDQKIYFVPSVENIGYVIGHKLANRIIMQWPSSKYIIKFPDVAEAIAHLERELNAAFIQNPMFNITVKALSRIDKLDIEVFNPALLNGYYIACYAGVIPLLKISKLTLKVVDITLPQLEQLTQVMAERKIFDKCYELIRKLFVQTGTPYTTTAMIEMIINEIRYQEDLERKLLIYHRRLTDTRRSLRTKCTTVIKELQPLVSTKMQNAMNKILNFNKSMIDDKPASTSGDVICIDADSEEDTSQITEVAEPSKKAPPPYPPLVPKITVKRIQDLKEPSTSTNSSGKLVSFKSFSILKNKNPIPCENTASAANHDVVQKTSSKDPIDTSSSMRPPDSNHCKTFTIKRSVLNNKKCSKFVIKTSNGKFMTIRAEDLKELPVKKLQPIAPDDPVITKLNMGTKRVLMRNKTNGFLKVNFGEKSLFSDTVDSAPASLQISALPSSSPSSSSSSSPSPSLSSATNVTIVAKKT